ncbi:hypothetical protein ACTFIV_008942 [Dictyostelium citrinum]
MMREILNDIENSLQSKIKPEEFTNLLENHIYKLKELDELIPTNSIRSSDQNSVKPTSTTTTTTTTTTTSPPNTNTSPNSKNITSNQTLSPSVLLEDLNLSENDFEEGDDEEEQSSSDSSSATEITPTKKPKPIPNFNFITWN